MSPRTDSYLSLCLEQASQSSLHYRHGCIIVSGGKIIGNGYNHYRPGYNGGALKTGKLAACSATNSPTILALKRRQKQKPTPKSRQFHESVYIENTHEKAPEAVSKSTFTPFESLASDFSGGGRHLANTPLSMHSEMMAIHSVLSTSSTLASQSSARSARWLIKPCFKLQGGSKRQLRLRSLTAPALHMRHVASDAVAGLRFKGRTLKGLHLNAVTDKECNKKNVNKAEKKEEEEVKKKKEGSDVEYQQPGQQHASSRLKSHGPNISTSFSSKSARNAQPTTKDDVKQNNMCISLKTPPDVDPTPEPAKDHLKNSPTLLLPRARTGAKAHTVIDRMKDSRLRGADLYVARLGWQKTNGSTVLPIEPDNSDDLDNAKAPVVQGTNTIPNSEPVARTRSLHDELQVPAHSTPSGMKPPVVERPCVSASRPCYRCICYMHTVGIKRVFWTNAKGEWEGAKVRNMMDALDLSGSEDRGGIENGSTGGPAGNGVFVTKHEVLMLRRLMGI
ncbi:hypothetical protein MMC11_000084 [Xylographa trunciseda]|nr:hypothetical protein [Xylographa trunciseda]